MKIKKHNYADAIGYRIITQSQWHGFYNGENIYFGYHYKNQMKGFCISDRKYENKKNSILRI